MIPTQQVEFTIDFKMENTHITIGDTKLKYNREQALNLLKKDHFITTTDDCHIVGFSGKEFMQLHNAIKDYYGLGRYI